MSKEKENEKLKAENDALWVVYSIAVIGIALYFNNIFILLLLGIPGIIIGSGKK